MDTHTLAWTLYLGFWTLMLLCGPWRWGYGLPHFVLGLVVEPSTHLYLWEAKGNEMYMHSLIEELSDKGIPLTAKLVGFQRFDDWTASHKSLRMPHMLLQTYAAADLAKFTRLGLGLCDARSRLYGQRSLGAMPVFFGFSIVTPSSPLVQQLTSCVLHFWV